MSQHITAQERPQWLSSELYPFADRYFPLGQQQMHYLDEGEGDPIVFVHGTPTWSFLWRKMISEFSKTHRCIAVDHLGYGLSDKPKDFSYSAQTAAEHLERLLESLDLQRVTLVVHDFGGPIGLNYALKHSDRIKNVVILNTWMWATAEDPGVQKINRILKNPLGKFLYLHMNFSPKVLLKKGFADKSKLDKTVHRHYRKVWQRSRDRQGPYQMGLSLLGDSDWYQSLWEQREKLAKLNMRLIWCIQDDFIRPEYLERWQKAFPQAAVRRLSCGHFPQEEAPEELLSEIRSVLQP